MVEVGLRRVDCGLIFLLIFRRFMNDKQQPEFEWDAGKAEANQRKHGIAFEAARLVFKDGFAVEWLDADLPYGEARYVITGMGRRTSAESGLQRAPWSNTNHIGAQGDTRLGRCPILPTGPESMR
jgi:Ribonuclease toxin, BrnT, of type II toxin-antitoxin system